MISVPACNKPEGGTRDEPKFGNDWHELSALYERGDALSDTAFQAWIAQLRTSAHPLVGKLQAPLDARQQARAEAMLETLPGLMGAESGPVTAASTGRRIGPYKLLRHLGSGGMAEVWLAERVDGAFQRTVAIKLLFRHAAGAQRANFTQRFARERDILASLHHPFIAALHDAGITPEGEPWLALEYVDGEPLTAACDTARLDIRARVCLFRRVLLAVEHAHANLVIHRDLKPANILVTPDGEVRLLDFGVAKLLDLEGGALAETELTRQNGRPLTLRYASPEQLEGKPLTTTSDVYSLGVVLYELLCGEGPYELVLKSAAQLEQAIAQADPCAPSRRTISALAAGCRNTSAKQLRKTLALDLDAITLQALCKRPDHRYRSVEALRSDLDHWLAHEPVLARGPNRLYQAQRFIGRHRLGVGLGTAAAAALVVVASAATVLGISARQEATRAIASRDFLLDLFRMVNPDVGHKTEMSARELLETGRARAAVSLNDQPELQAELLAGIGEVQSGIGEAAQAQQAVTQVERIYQRLGKRREALMASIERASAATLMGDAALAARLLDEADALAPRYKNDSRLLGRLAEVRGFLESERGNLVRAKASTESALVHARRFFGDNDGHVVNALLAVADVESELREHTQAMRHIDEAAQVASRTRGMRPSDLIALELGRARIALADGRYGTVIGPLEASAAHCDAVLGPTSESCVLVRVWQATTMLRLGRSQDAMPIVPALMPAVLNDSSPKAQLESLMVVCRVLAANGQLASDHPMRQRLERAAGAGPEMKQGDSTVARAQMVVGEFLLLQGSMDKAWALMASVLSRESTGGLAKPYRLARAQMLAGMAAQGLGRHDEALVLFRQADVNYGLAFGEGHVLGRLFALNQTRSLLAIGRTDLALTLFDRVLPDLKERFGTTSPTTQRVVRLRAELMRSEPVRIAAVDVADFFL